jgi:hypothetical protein
MVSERMTSPEEKKSVASARSQRKVLCSIGHGPYEELLRHSAPTFMGYAAKHDYDVVLRFAVPTGARPIAWAKVPLIRQLLENYDVVLWIDADAIIVDKTYDIADEARPGDWMCLCRHETSEGLVPNTGVWMFAASTQAKTFLERVEAHRGFDHHHWWENAAVIDLLGYEFDPVRLGSEKSLSGVRYLDNSWNSVAGAPAPRPRIKHYAGLPFDVRAAAIRSDADANWTEASGLAVPTDTLQLTTELRLGRV